MAIDESFKKPGTIPFKWEIRPGVPKSQHHRHRQPPPLPSPEDPPRHGRPSPPKLKPPPAGLGLQFPSPLEPRAGSFRSVPRTRSERWRLGPPMLGQPECVSAGPGCFPAAAPLLKRKESKRRTRRTRPEPEPEPEPDPDRTSDLETLSRVSVSSRRSPSPFCESPCSSSYWSVGSSPRLSFSSYMRSRQSAPRCMGDPEWAGFGLF